MKKIITFTPVILGLKAVLLLSSLLIVGCSSSSRSEGDELETAHDSSGAMTLEDGDGNTNPSDPNEAETQPPVDTDNDPDPGSATPAAPIDGAAGVDPLTTNTTRVDFDITVPAYQSNELRVSLVVNDETITASWIGDEIWSATIELPMDQEHQFSVTFYDRNGALELARYSGVFITGSNAAQELQITANEFDTAQFDDDSDGNSNLDESIAGTDPTVDEDALLEIKERVFVQSWPSISASEGLESRMSDERPYFESLVTTPDDQNLEGSTTGSVNIDQSGNGTLNYTYDFFACDRQRLSGTRTVSENAVKWDSEYSRSDCDYTRLINTSSMVTVIDDDIRTYTEESENSNIGTFTFLSETSVDVMGERVPGTSFCLPISGTVSSIHYPNTERDQKVTTVSKARDDQYWRVVIVTTGTIQTNTFEYLARELVIQGPFAGGDPSDETPVGTFRCEFVD